MNKHIYKVIKWLEDPKSVSQKERDKSKKESYAYHASYAYHVFYADSASYSAADNDREAAIIWVNEYLEETGEEKQDYLDAIKEEK